MDDLDFNAVLTDGMSEALDAIAVALENVAEVMSQVAETISSGMAESAAATAELQASIDDLSLNVDALSTSVDANTAATDANTASTKANKDAAETNAAAHEKMAAAAKSMIMPLGIATAVVVGIGAAAVHMAGDFQSGLTSLVTGAGESQSNLQMIHDGILQMSVATGESTKQLVDGMFMIESSGAHGARALSELQAAAEGAKVGGADLGAMANALTTVLANYGAKGVTAAQATNDLIQIVSHGKSHMQDLATSISTVLPAAAKYGVSLTDVSAALATMTAQNGDAASSTTYMKQLLTALASPSAAAQKALASIGLSAQQVSDDMKKSLPDTLQLITDHINSTFKPGSVAANEAFKSIAGGSRQMQGMLLLTGDSMKTFKENAREIAGAAKQGGNQIQGWNLVQKDFNQQLSEGGAALQVAMIKLGEALMPVATALLQHLQPALNWILTHGPLIATGLLILAGTLAGALVTALGITTVAWFTANAAALPMIAIGAGIGLALAVVIGGFILAYNHIKPFHDAVNAIGGGLRTFWNILQPIGKEIAGQIAPIFRQLGAQLKSELAPAWASLVAAFNTAKPALQVIGAIIGGVLVVAVGVLIGALAGFAEGLAQFIAGSVQFFAGLIQAVSGFVKLFTDYWSGLFTIIGDLFSGNWSKLGKDTHTWLTQMWNDVKQIGAGIWNALKGLFQMGVGTIYGIVQGFVTGIVGWFTHLWDVLVGHSIVPDMINGIINWFKSLPGKAIAEVRLLAALVMTEFDGLARQATQFGQHLIQNLINGIKNMAGAVGSAASSVAGTIKNFLGWHSPTEEGPGADADQWMPNLMRMLAHDMTTHAPLLGAAARVAAGQVAGILGAPGASSGGSLTPAGLLAAGAGGGGLAGTGPVQVTVVLKDETGMGGFMAGARLLNPGVMQLLAQQIAKEMAAQGLLQGRQPIGYTGSR